MFSFKPNMVLDYEHKSSKFFIFLISNWYLFFYLLLVLFIYILCALLLVIFIVSYYLYLILFKEILMYINGKLK